MYNNEKLEREITTNDYIYCDTCIAMSKGFESFVNKFGRIFKKHKKKIIIIADVYKELLSKAYIGNDSQKHFAEKAIEIINNNSDIFNVEIDNTTPCSAFADPKLLARLIENKAHSTQLLITRDNGLSIDAKRFNSLRSVDGKRIKVCYVNGEGDMNNFARCESFTNEQNIKYIEVEKIIEKPVVKIVKEKPSAIDTYVKPAVVAGFTYVVIYNRERIVNFVKNVFKEIRGAIA